MARRAGALVAAALLAGAGCNVAPYAGVGFEFGGDGPAAVDDETLARAVGSQLAGDPAVGDTNIRAEVHEGVVTLKGSVPSQVVADRAVELAGGVAGVKGVLSELAIGPPSPD